MFLRILGLTSALVMVSADACVAQTSETMPRLKKALAQYPDADANGDGILTMQEALAYLPKVTAGDDQTTSKSDMNRSRPVFETEIFKATAEELDRAMQAENVATGKEALQFPKGNGLRIVSTGHSWVGPALRTLPQISLAAGLDGQHIRSHTSGGGTGSANSIWRKEFGKYGDAAARPILLPAIATGQWDVMTWGAFYGDLPEHYSQWMDVCIKASPEMIFYIQDGWPTFDAALKDASGTEAIKKIDESQRQMQSGMFKQLYVELTKKYPEKLHIMPASAAVVQMLHDYYDGKLTGFDCVSEHLGGKKGIYRDGGHLSKESGMEWLIGYVYYGMLYRRSPELIKDFHPPNVSTSLDQCMRAAAWKAITNSPYSGIQDTDQNGIGEGTVSAGK